MAEQNERPRPHGDPLEDAIEGDNQAQRQSDAPTEESVRGDLTEEPSERSDRAHGRGSDANGIPAFDEAAGDKRKQQYKDGAELVSRMD